MKMDYKNITVEEPDELSVTNEDPDLQTQYNGFGISAFGATDGSINISSSGGTGEDTYTYS